MADVTIMDDDEESLASNGSDDSENVESYMRSSIKESTHIEYDKCYAKFISWLNSNTENKQTNITYGSTFINNSLLSPTLPEGAVLNFLQSLAKSKELDRNGKKVRYSHSRVAKYRTAIRNKAPQIFSKSLNDKCHTLLTGIKKKIKIVKQSGGLSLKHGKDQLTYSGYQTLCSVTHRRKDIDLHTFNVLCWNLCCRGDTLAHMKFDHMEWIGDHIEMTLEKEKQNQVDVGNVKNIFANPLEDALCPILALALHVICRGYVFYDLSKDYDDDGNIIFRKIFINDNNISTLFIDNLKKLIDAEPTIKRCSDIVNFNLGCHSIRKGVATMAGNIIGGPSAYTVAERLGWKKVEPDKRYIVRESGGDSCLGRIVCGLDIHTSSFSVLPPRFRSIDDNKINQFKSVILDYENYSESFKRIIPYLIARIAHSFENLNKLPTQHPWFRSQLFNSGLIGIWKSENAIMDLTLSYCEVTKMKASGLSPLTIVMITQDKLQEKLETILALIGHMNNQRIVTSVNSSSTGISRDEMLELLSARDLEMKDAMKSMTDDVVKVVENFNNQRTNNQHNITNSTMMQLNGSPYLPPNFRLQQFTGDDVKTSVLDVWNYYHYGSITSNLPPLHTVVAKRHFNKSDKDDYKRECRIFSAIRSIVDFILRKIYPEIHEREMRERMIRSSNKEGAIQLFISALNAISLIIYPNGGWDKIVFMTFYNRLSSLKLLVQDV